MSFHSNYWPFGFSLLWIPLKFFSKIFKSSPKDRLWERKGERNMDHLPFVCAPTGDWTRETQMCGLTKNRTSNLSVHRTTLNQLHSSWTTVNSYSISLFFQLGIFLKWFVVLYVFWIQILCWSYVLKIFSISFSLSLVSFDEWKFFIIMNMNVSTFTHDLCFLYHV